MEVVVQELPTPQFAVYGGSCSRNTYSIVCSLWSQLFKNYLLNSLQFMELGCSSTTFSIVCSLWSKFYWFKINRIIYDDLRCPAKTVFGLTCSRSYPSFSWRRRRTSPSFEGTDTAPAVNLVIKDTLHLKRHACSIHKDTLSTSK